MMIEKPHFQCNDFMLIHHKLKLAENSIVEWWQMPLILFSPFHLTGSQLCNHFKTYRSISYHHFKFRIAIEYFIPLKFLLNEIFNCNSKFEMMVANAAVCFKVITQLWTGQEKKKIKLFPEIHIILGIERLCHVVSS